MRLTDFDALTFDCYGTLIDWERGIYEGLRPLLARVGRPIPRDEALGTFARHETEQEALTPAMPYSELLAVVHGRLVRDWGVPPDAEEDRRFGGSVPDWPAFPDSPDALTALSERYMLLILSNVDRVSFAASNERLGVEFTSILTAEDIGSYKPSPRNFDALGAEARRLGIGTGKLLHVAQSLFHDHVPAKKAGLPTVWINRRHAKPGWGATPAPEADVIPDWTFTSMAEFAAAVDANA